jgi:hypothetical protein
MHAPSVIPPGGPFLCKCVPDRSAIVKPDLFQVWQLIKSHRQLPINSAAGIEAIGLPISATGSPRAPELRNQKGFGRF